MSVGRSYLGQDNILQHVAEDMIDNIGEESDKDSVTGYEYSRRFLEMKGGFQ